MSVRSLTVVVLTSFATGCGPAGGDEALGELDPVAGPAPGASPDAGVGSTEG